MRNRRFTPVNTAVIITEGGAAAGGGGDTGPLTLASLSLDDPNWPVNAAAGDVLGTLEGVTENSALSLSPADGRVEIVGSELRRGVTPWSLGPLALSLVETHPDADNSPRTTDLNAAIEGVVTLADLVPDDLTWPVDAAPGTVLATLAGVSGGSALAVSPNDGRIVVVGNELRRGATAWTLGALNFALVETSGIATNSPHTTNLSATVEPTVTLGALSLSAYTFTTGSGAGAVIGAIQGLSPGSTVTVNPADTRVAIDGSNNLIVGLSAADVGTFDVTLRETHPAAGNSPRSTTLTLTVLSEVDAQISLILQPTDDQWVPEVIALLGDNPDNPVTVTNSGNVALRIWRDDELLAGGEARAFYQREICDGYLRAVTTGHAVNSLSHTDFTYYDGPNATGSLITKRIVWTVQLVPRLTYAIGARTPAGFGGFPVHKLPGNIADKTISQSTAGALAIWTDSGDATKAWLTWAGTTYGALTSPGRTVAAPTQGAGTYWVDVTDTVLGETWRVTFDVDNRTLNARPAPGRDVAGNGGSHQLTRLMDGGITPFRAGDTVLSEGGTYPNLGTTRVWFPAAANGEGGITPPTSPFVADAIGGWKPDGNRALRMHAGWRVVRSRVPLAVVPAFPVNMQPASANGYNAHLRFTGFQGYVTGFNGATAAYGWLCNDHCKVAGVTLGSRDAQTALFLLDNQTSGFMSIAGRDCGMAGNFSRGIATGDAYNIQYYSSDNTRKAFFAWNHGTDKGVATGDHADWCQVVFSTGVQLLMYALPAGSTIHLPDIYGNSFDRGVGSTWVDGSVGTQIFLMGDVRTDCLQEYRVGGNVGQDLTPHGIWFKNANAASKFRNNTMLYAYGVVDPFDGAGFPIIRADGTPSEANWERGHNFASGAYQSANGHAAPTAVNNRENVDKDTAEGLVAAPSVFQTSRKWSQFLADLSPLAVNSGLTKEAGGAARARIQGALGDAALIDHRRNTVAATFWA